MHHHVRGEVTGAAIICPRLLIIELAVKSIWKPGFGTEKFVFDVYLVLYYQRTLGVKLVMNLVNPTECQTELN